MQVMNLPNLEELSFCAVFAFPKASKIGDASNILASIDSEFPIFKNITKFSKCN